jgi:hypothetical protein
VESRKTVVQTIQLCRKENIKNGTVGGSPESGQWYAFSQNINVEIVECHFQMISTDLYLLL